MQFINNNTFLQIAFWVIFWALFIFFFAPKDEFQIVTVSLILISVSLVVWLNLRFLLPKFYFNNNQIWYAFLAPLIIICIARLDLELEKLYVRDSHYLNLGNRFSMMRFIMPSIFALVGSTLNQLSVVIAQKEKEASDLRSEKLETEMKFLKSQINPHFLFNALNNIYTQVILNQQDAPDNLLKLSDILRYVLYDCNVEKVPLQKEITYIKHYISLFSLKDSSGINLKTTIEDAPAHLKIAPLLLIPFVENAFKHSGIEKIGQGWVEITLNFEGNLLQFTVKNSKTNEGQPKDKTHGIGLENVKRRLTLLYPSQHILTIDDNNTQFEVFLSIKL